MKDLLINSAIHNIQKYYSYDKTKLEEIKYGLTGLYLHITKLIVIFSLSYILGYIIPLLILMALYSILRLTGFGVHAKKSWHCWIVSILTFLITPYLCTKLTIYYEVKVALGSRADLGRPKESACANKEAFMRQMKGDKES